MYHDMTKTLKFLLGNNKMIDSFKQLRTLKDLSEN